MIVSNCINVLVVGQTPPPVHGQAVMIERLLRGKYASMRLFHVRMAFSDSIADVGRFQLGKLWHLLSVIVRIICQRVARRIDVLYYPPAGPNVVPLLRDVVILGCTRWMFRKTVFHFHIIGISEAYRTLPRPLRVARAWHCSRRMRRFAFPTMPSQMRSYSLRSEFALCPMGSTTTLHPTDFRRLNAAAIECEFFSSATFASRKGCAILSMPARFWQNAKFLSSWNSSAYSIPLNSKLSFATASIAGTFKRKFISPDRVPAMRNGRHSLGPTYCACRPITMPRPWCCWRQCGLRFPSLPRTAAPYRISSTTRKPAV